jgi:hypothetical protein
MLTENTVTVSGALHLIHGQMIRESKSGRYVHFSVRQETPANDGGTRRDFLLVRAFDPEIQAWVQEQAEGTTVRVIGAVRSSLGSGEMYIQAVRVEALSGS